MLSFKKSFYKRKITAKLHLSMKQTISWTHFSIKASGQLSRDLSLHSHKIIRFLPNLELLFTFKWSAYSDAFYMGKAYPPQHRALKIWFKRLVNKILRDTFPSLKPSSAGRCRFWRVLWPDVGQLSTSSDTWQAKVTLWNLWLILPARWQQFRTWYVRAKRRQFIWVIS